MLTLIVNQAERITRLLNISVFVMIFISVVFLYFAADEEYEVQRIIYY